MNKIYMALWAVSLALFGVGTVNSGIVGHAVMWVSGIALGIGVGLRLCEYTHTRPNNKLARFFVAQAR